MKNIKKILFVLVALFAFVLVGCGGSKDPNKPVNPDEVNKPNIETTAELQTAVRKQLDAYLNADHGSFKITNKKGEKTSTVEMVFNYELNKADVTSLAASINNENGTISCYIKEGMAYTNRYDQAKNQFELGSNEGVDIVEKYSFEQFAKTPNMLLNNSFFKACSIVPAEGAIRAELDINAYDISTEIPSDELTALFDMIKEKDAVAIEVKFDENKEAKEITILVTSAEGVATSTLELKGLSDKDIAITYPDFTDYVK